MGPYQVPESAVLALCSAPAPGTRCVPSPLDFAVPGSRLAAWELRLRLSLQCWDRGHHVAPQITDAIDTAAAASSSGTLCSKPPIGSAASPGYLGESMCARPLDHARSQWSQAGSALEQRRRELADHPMQQKLAAAESRLRSAEEATASAEAAVVSLLGDANQEDALWRDARAWREAAAARVEQARQQAQAEAEAAERRRQQEEVRARAEAQAAAERRRRAAEEARARARAEAKAAASRAQAEAAAKQRRRAAEEASKAEADAAQQRRRREAEEEAQQRAEAQQRRREADAAQQQEAHEQAEAAQRRRDQHSDDGGGQDGSEPQSAEHDPAAEAAAAAKLAVDIAEIDRVLTARNAYEVLQLPRNCTKRDVERKHKRMMMRLHPDKCRAPRVTEAAQRLNQAKVELRFQ